MHHVLELLAHTAARWPGAPVTVTKAMLIPGLKPGPPLRRLAQRWTFCPAVCSAGRLPFWLTAALRQYMQCWAHWQPAGFILCLTLPRGKAACGISFPRWRPLRFWPMQPIWRRRKFWPVRRQCWAWRLRLRPNRSRAAWPPCRRQPWIRTLPICSSLRVQPGRPKGVAVTHRNLLAYSEWVVNTLRLRAWHGAGKPDPAVLFHVGDRPVRRHAKRRLRADPAQTAVQLPGTAARLPDGTRRQRDLLGAFGAGNRRKLEGA